MMVGILLKERMILVVVSENTFLLVHLDSQ